MRHSQGKSHIEKIREGIQKGFFHDYYGNITSIAILLDNSDNSQAYFYAAMKIGKYLQSRADVELSLYTIISRPPVFWPQCAMYDIMDLKTFTGNAIATSINTTEILMSYPLIKGYFYVYDIAELWSVSKEFIERLQASKITIFTRNDDYRDVLQKHFNLKVSSMKVADFNMDNIVKVIRN